MLVEKLTFNYPLKEKLNNGKKQKWEAETFIFFSNIYWLWKTGAVLKLLRMKHISLKQENWDRKNIPDSR